MGKKRHGVSLPTARLCVLEYVFDGAATPPNRFFSMYFFEKKNVFPYSKTLDLFLEFKRFFALGEQRMMIYYASCARGLAADRRRFREAPTYDNSFFFLLLAASASLSLRIEKKKTIQHLNIENLMKKNYRAVRNKRPVRKNVCVNARVKESSGILIISFFFVYEIYEIFIILYRCFLGDIIR